MLKDYQLKLLRDVIGKRCPELEHRVSSTDLSSLSFTERQAIIAALSAEFAASGVGKDWEPTQRGIEIEHLIDVVNRPNLENQHRPEHKG